MNGDSSCVVMIHVLSIYVGLEENSFSFCKFLSGLPVSACEIELCNDLIYQRKAMV